MSPPMARTHFTAAALGLFVLGASVSGAQTLAELAKKEQERRKAIKAPAKVLTSQDVPKGAPPAPAAPPAASGAKPDAKADAKGDEPVKDEAWWRARLTPLREDLRRNEMFGEALQTRINSLASDFASRDDPYQRARIADDRMKALAELDRIKADIDQAKKKIADIEEEARRAGVPPGWLR